MSDGRIYVGNLPTAVTERDIEDLFFKYGKIREVELKNNRGTVPFAFIRFEDPRDADDAVYGRNGYEYGNSKLRVEYPRVSGGKPGSMGGAGGGGQRGRFGPPTRRSEFRVTVTGLPASGSWQDLKDHMREAGDVCFADVQRDGDGVVEFLRREDMEYALRRLDRTEFRSHQGETSFIRVYEDRGSSSWAPARSRSRSRGRYSPPYFNRGSPPPLPRYHSPPRMLRHSPPPRRLPPQHHSPPPRHYR
ncbi:serine/arginine-rich splicing factor 9 isoform X2 [Nothobranchius furzeri]|uniref:Serine/arginine-rich splicing factor 9 n=2 Tax=Nothobranchius TaxID=28779 RepID=A0A1A8ABN9_NOTFU|nr:serine/arginine-rich splicing factor 9 isoform X2 [Nothobranchius furzeri]XP_015797298.1 serine/arginine-rich splicing factor 9 isoform X2 [Nothobranchius furzeri]XP_054600298.1 serine/arginine-rich splicing factor 9 isoform X2 [Nothobranchius furzeri]KAF7217081.1 transcript variant X1 [Nothobranchius furzeri]KAF7217082.1 transcript variant X2 [Nothobranchius furzeri]